MRRSRFVQALLDELADDPEARAMLAESLASELSATLAPPAAAEDGWLDSIGAAAYLSITRNALHKLTAAREIPFEQECTGGKLWFKRSELDDWRRGQWQRSKIRYAA